MPSTPINNKCRTVHLADGSPFDYNVTLIGDDKGGYAVAVAPTEPDTDRLVAARPAIEDDIRNNVGIGRNSLEYYELRNEKECVRVPTNTDRERDAAIRVKHDEPTQQAEPKPVDRSVIDEKFGAKTPQAPAAPETTRDINLSQEPFSRGSDFRQTDFASQSIADKANFRETEQQRQLETHDR